MEYSPASTDNYLSMRNNGALAMAEHAESYRATASVGLNYAVTPTQDYTARSLRTTRQLPAEPAYKTDAPESVKALPSVQDHTAKALLKRVRELHEGLPKRGEELHDPLRPK